MQKLPNSDLVLGMGIASIIGTLICCGPFGAIFSIIGLIKANEAERVWQQNPNEYTGYDNVKTGRVLSWIGVGLAVIMLILTIVYFGFIYALIMGAQNGYIE